MIDWDKLQELPAAPPQPYVVPLNGPAGEWLTLIFIVMMGACIGSFLSVCIWRIPRGEDIIRKPSHCPVCRKGIPFFLNIPILGWLSLRGRCFNCKTKVPARYILLESFCAIIVTIVWLRAGTYRADLPLALFWIYLTSMFVTISWIDMDHCIIPDGVNLTTAAIGLAVGLTWPVSRLGGIDAFTFDLAQTHVITYAFASIFSDGVPGIIKSPRLFFLLDAFLGMVFGGGFLWIMGEIGKRTFGTRREKAKGQLNAVTLTHDSFQEYPDEPAEPWEDIFERKWDRLTIMGTVREITDYDGNQLPIPKGQTKLTANWQEVTVGETTIQLENVGTIQMDAMEWIVPREAMGLGDVKLLAALGICLGPGGMLFTLTAGSILGASLGLGIRAVRTIFSKDSSHGMIPFGPYLAMGAYLYIVAADTILSKYAQMIQHVADTLGR